MACPTNSRQQPLFAVRRFLPQPYKTGSFFDVVERFGGLIIKAEDFPRASHEAGGIEGICVVLKSKLVLIQRMHGWSDEETVLRATTDLGVKACLGLGVDQPGPSQPTLSRHRQPWPSTDAQCCLRGKVGARKGGWRLARDQKWRSRRAPCRRWGCIEPSTRAAPVASS